MQSSIITLLTRLSIPLLMIAACSSQPVVTNLADSATDPVNPPPTVQVGGEAGEVNMFILSSTAFMENGTIAEKYTYKLGRQCNGENYSPPLKWEGIPEGTRSLLLTVIDPDGGNWLHWLLFNIPPHQTALEETVNGPQVGVAGRNDFGDLGYGGPCPPSGTHRYVFTLFALDTVLDASEGASLKNILPMLDGHILGKAILTALKTAK